MRRNLVFVIVALVAAMSFTTLAMAQRISGTERSAILAAAPRVQTSVKGVTAFAGPPKGFNPLTATNRELLSYGLPQAPDKTENPGAYQMWVKGMTSLKTTATDVKAQPFSAESMRPYGEAKADVSGVTFYNSLNWSGIANTNKLTKWNTKTSFDEVVSFFPVPVSEHPNGNLPCSEGPWYEVTWNGIDGFNNGDVVQGGSYDYWDGGGCGGTINYYGWVEWYPSYPILVIYCGSSPCPVSPGDDFEVVTFGAPGTEEQFVYVEDFQQGWSGTFGLDYASGPGVVGSSAEYIVERPCCNSAGYPLPLANYIFEPMLYNYAYDAAGKLFYPGSAAVTTAVITMEANPDADYQDISFPFLYGSAGNSGKFSITMEVEGCAYSGGCSQ
jgi:Peptidase A4 family